MAESSSARRSRRIRTQRLEAFSDGVFAIAVTLLVLDIGVPIASAQDPLPALLEQWPSYLTYIVSFATIGALWLGHSIITEYLDHADAVLIRLNLLLLLLVSFLPFPTRLLGEYISREESERVAVTVYGLTLIAASGALSLVWRYAIRERLISDDVDDVELMTLTRRLTPGLAGYVVLIVVGLVLPIVALIGYLAVAAFFLIPIRPRGRRRIGEAPPGSPASP